MKTMTPRRKPGIRRKAGPGAARPTMPAPPAGMGPLARKLDAAFREIAAGQVTVREVNVTAPREYAPSDVRAVRQAMRVSQGVFALLVGVSSETVENWEQGVIVPRPMARRLLDLISANPVGYRSMFLKHAEAGS
jgi:DNA-binding transcriptional regulator YiaG